MKPPIGGAVEEALAHCLDAALWPAAWPDAMERLAHSIGSSAACLNTPGDGVDRKRLPASARYADLLEEFVGGNWSSRDIRAQRGWRLLKADRSGLIEDDLSTPQERASLDIYQDLFRRHDLENWATAGFRIEGELWVQSFLRPRSSGPFTEAHVAQLSQIRPVMARIVRLAKQVSIEGGVTALSLMTRARRAAILLDWRGCVIEINEAADRILGEELQIVGGELVARDLRNARSVRRLIDQARARVQLSQSVVLRREGLLPLILECTLLRGDNSERYGLHGAILLLTDLERDSAPSRDRLCEVLGLTRAEADVVALLTVGLTTSEIARKRNIKPDTVRQQLKSSLAKTGRRRQSELVQLATRLG